MKIKRKKMETESWAKFKYEQLLYERKEIEHRIDFDIPCFQGEELSRWKQKKNYARLERNDRKLRQVRLILDKLGIEY